MGITCIQGKTLCLTLKDWKWGHLVFHRKRLEPRELPWQQLRRCHFLPFVMHISGAKFEEHCSNISRDMLLTECCNDLVEPSMMSSLSTFAYYKNVNISMKKKRYSKKKKAILLYFEKPFK